MNDSLKSDKPTKAPYQPPAVVRVTLRPEEAVLGHCKISSSPGPLNSSCRSTFCRTQGS